jgi:hypothetical protein
MPDIGFLRPVTIGVGRQAVTVHHEVVPMPERNADELRQAHPGAVADLTPKALGYPVHVPVPLSPLRLRPCPTCAGQRRMTACRTCNGLGRVMEIR